MQVVRRYLTRDISRRFSCFSQLRNIQEPPRNAPTSTENDTWLDKLKEEEQDTFSNLNTSGTSFLVERKSKNDLHEGIYHEIGDVQYEVLGKDEVGFIDVGIPAKSLYMRSSPFSHMSSKSRPKADSNQTFSDIRVVKIKAGTGGNGMISFFRDAGRAVGPPDGGDGGDGGNLYVQAVEGLNSLHNVKSTYKAGDGTGGAKTQLDGKRGKDIVIQVPVGTMIKWIPEPQVLRQLQNDPEGEKTVRVKTKGEFWIDYTPKYIQLFRNSYPPGEGWLFKEKDEEFHQEKQYFLDLNRKVRIYDRTIAKEEFETDIFPLKGIDLAVPSLKPILLLKGGKGGMGNMHFLTKDIRNPRFAKKGRTGIEESFIFELKLLADLGLVGLPNAGKSTLLRAISKARPKVGHWEFTTLHPTIGTIDLGIDKKSFTVADIPGIIAGASENKGMGLDFLRHVERSGGIVFVIALDKPNPVADLKLLINEMGPKRLRFKRVLVVGTKADIRSTRKRYSELREYVESNDWKCVPCCAPNGENIELVIRMMGEAAGCS